MEPDKNQVNQNSPVNPESNSAQSLDQGSQQTQQPTQQPPVISSTTPQYVNNSSSGITQQTTMSPNTTIGILAIVFAFLFFPVGFILSIIAIFKGKQVKKLRIMGIVALSISIIVPILLILLSLNAGTKNALISTQIYVYGSTNKLTIGYPVLATNNLITTVGSTPSTSDLNQVLCKSSQMSGDACSTYYFDEKVTATTTGDVGIANINQAVSYWKNLQAKGGSKDLVLFLSAGSTANSVGSVSINQVNINGQAAAEISLSDVILDSTGIAGPSVSYTGLVPSTPLDLKAYIFVSGNSVYVVQLSATSSYWQSNASEFTNILNSISIK